MKLIIDECVHRWTGMFVSSSNAVRGWGKDDMVNMHSSYRRGNKTRLWVIPYLYMVATEVLNEPSK